MNPFAGRDLDVLNDFGRPRLYLNVEGANGDWWYLDFAAPGGGRPAVGVYDGADGFPFQAPDRSRPVGVGNGRGCNTLTGSFEVFEAQYAADGTPTRLRASFEQHCEGLPRRCAARSRSARRGGGATRGPPPPLGVTINADGMIASKTAVATVAGPVTCSSAAQVSVAATIEQQLKRCAVEWRFVSRRTVACSPPSTAWTATARHPAAGGGGGGLGCEWVPRPPRRPRAGEQCGVVGGAHRAQRGADPRQLRRSPISRMSLSM